ncbi:cytochrome c oxidase subunit II [uncultured Maricaulis sp.]|uniref:cytochrome c oxidase subunit II n=1 Tax=uncultured Maricaulis sp. TaxID=174710 RepID=UPI0030DCB28E|tara:strand:+ start:23606 stop:24442 length:837 start_codon:yes stop_codon:yes gene_type:complete
MRFLTAIVLTWFLASTSAFALSVPVDGALGLQHAVTPIMERITEFHNLLLWIIIPITLFVMGLLIYCMIRFNSKNNPVPSKNSHNTLLEVVWTALPVVILIAISVFSFPLLYYQEEIPDADFTIKATGSQWNWTFEYPDQGAPEYLSMMVPEADLQPGQLRNLSVDYPLVVPLDATIRLQVTATDVIHNFAMPAFGTKIDAIPGRINESWFQVTEEGVYYGQCSELCGLGHAYMPIEVHVVSQAAFDAWIAAEPGSDESNAVIASYEAARNTRLAQLD